jgi:myosin-5
VLDLIDGKGTGIINILDDQCRTPGATDKSFSMFMYDTCNQHSRFEADPRQIAENKFAINHYAGLVEYSAEGFIEKNKDEMPKAGVDLLLSSTNNFIKNIATDMVQLSTSAASEKKLLIAPRGAAQRATVGIQFSAQLHDLRRKIGLTSPHCE